MIILILNAVEQTLNGEIRKNEYLVEMNEFLKAFDNVGHKAILGLALSLRN